MGHLLECIWPLGDACVRLVAGRTANHVWDGTTGAFLGSSWAGIGNLLLAAGILLVVVGASLVYLGAATVVGVGLLVVGGVLIGAGLVLSATGSGGDDDADITHRTTDAASPLESRRFPQPAQHTRDTLRCVELRFLPAPGAPNLAAPYSCRIANCSAHSTAAAGEIRAKDSKEFEARLRERLGELLPHAAASPNGPRVEVRIYVTPFPGKNALRQIERLLQTEFNKRGIPFEIHRSNQPTANGSSANR